MTNNVTLLLSDFSMLSEKEQLQAIKAIKEMELKMQLNEMKEQGGSQSVRELYQWCCKLSVEDIMILTTMLGRHLTIEQKVDCWMG